MDRSFWCSGEEEFAGIKGDILAHQHFDRQKIQTVKH